MRERERERERELRKSTINSEFREKNTKGSNQNIQWNKKRKLHSQEPKAQNEEININMDQENPRKSA